MGQAEIDAFWANARLRTRLARPAGVPEEAILSEEPPTAWSFGGTESQADELLNLVLTGVKTATASSLWEYEFEGLPIPEEGQLTIILDGDGMPRALIQTTSVTVKPFNEVGPEHVVAEAEGDLSVEHWREVHEWFFREHTQDPRHFAPDMPVVLQRFAVIFPSMAERDRNSTARFW